MPIDILKEIRNALILRGGLATQTNLDTRAQFCFDIHNGLRSEKAQLAPAAILGEKLRMELSDIVGGCRISGSQRHQISWVLS